MTTQTTETAHYDTTIAAVPLSRLLRVEMRKIVDTRAGRWLLIAIAAITALAMVLLFFTGDRTDLTLDNFVGVAGFPQGLLLPILGILAITSEWSQRTALVTFTLEPSRLRVVWAKCLSMIVYGLAAVVVIYALATAGNALASAARDGVGGWHYQADWVGEVTLAQLLGILQGLAFGMLLMNTAAAIVLYYVVPIAWSILFNAVSALESAAPWVDLGTATSPLLDHTMNAERWLHLLVAASIWVGLPLVVGVARLIRSEVK